MQRKNKCEGCEKNAVIKDDGKILCAECYMFRNNILTGILRTENRQPKFKPIHNNNKTLH